MNPDNNSERKQLSDHALMDLIAMMFELADPIPTDAVETAELFAEIDSLDFELASLTFDSYADQAAVVVRADNDGRRIVVCESEDLRISLELVDDGDVAIGQVEPGANALVVAEGLRERLTTTCDERGQFQLDLPSGLVRFCVHHQGASVATPWLSRRGSVADEG